MGNREKRAKRAKEKAKQARLARQRAARERNFYEVASPKLVEFFGSLPPPSEDLAFARKLGFFAIEQMGQTTPAAVEEVIALLSPMYHHWYRTKDTAYPSTEMRKIANILLAQGVFKEVAEACMAERRV